MNLTDYQEIKELLARHDFRFSKSLGQNFLTASWVVERIAEEAELDGETGVLEVGPGIGCLTEQLSMRAKKVVSIELDKALMPLLFETLSRRDNVVIQFGDVLKTDLGKIVSEDFGGLKPVVCANLPYNVTSPVLTRLVTSQLFDCVTVMIQKEVAQRICARENEADYSSFGILMQWYTKPEILFDVPPSCFVPQPKVTSSVIKLKKRDGRPAETDDEKLMFSLIRAAFNQRRKTFVNAASSGVNEVTKEMIANALNEAGLDEKVRGEAISIENYAKIANFVKKQLL